jgi:hypothetical protein
MLNSGRRLMALLTGTPSTAEAANAAAAPSPVQVVVARRLAGSGLVFTSRPLAAQLGDEPEAK